MSGDTILVVDGEEARRRQLRDVIAFIGTAPVIEAEPGQWQKQINVEQLQLLILASGEREMAELPALLEKFPHVPFFLCGEFEGELPEGVMARLDYPPRYTQFATALHRGEIYRQRKHPFTHGSTELAKVLVGRSDRMQKVRHLIEQVADSEANVLILGESGTGKEVVAKSLHYLSSRREHPFVPVNCGAIPGELLESELFGHEKGAFTGALTARQGRFEIAEGGTLFLDEIGDMPMPMQVKLLRVLQERTFERVGSNKSMNADVRVIAATHRNLEDNIQEGTFREDLYYRLNVFPIEMPALQERPEDVPLLANELIARLEREGRGSVRLTPAALTSLSRYPWPGNVRELANLMERLVIMYPNGIADVGDLPSKYQVEGVQADSEIPLPEVAAAPVADLPRPGGLSTTLPSDGVDLKEYLAELEQDFIQQALDTADGVVAHAAKLLNMRRTTLVEKMRKYGLQRNE